MGSKRQVALGDSGTPTNNNNNNNNNNQGHDNNSHAGSNNSNNNSDPPSISKNNFVVGYYNSTAATFMDKDDMSGLSSEAPHSPTKKSASSAAVSTPTISVKKRVTKIIKKTPMAKFFKTSKKHKNDDHNDDDNNNSHDDAFSDELTPLNGKSRNTKRKKKKKMKKPTDLLTLNPAGSDEVSDDYGDSYGDDEYRDDDDYDVEYNDEEGEGGDIYDEEALMVLKTKKISPRDQRRSNAAAYGAAGSSSIKKNSPIQSARAQRHWAKLKYHLEKGDFLLQGVSMNPNQKKNQKRVRDEQLVQRAIEEIRQGMEFSLWHCLVAIFVYLAISILCFNFIFEPEWSIIDSCYYAVTTFTTVGYGDLVPTTQAAMIFTCVYALVGVACLGIALGIIGSNLMDAQERVKAKADELLQVEVLGVFGSYNTTSTVAVTPTSPTSSDRGIIIPGDITAMTSAERRLQYQEQYNPSESSSFLSSSLAQSMAFLPLFGLLFGMAYKIGLESGWNLMETFYYVVITGCTVGYGDLAPTTELGRTIAILFIPLSVGLTGHWLGAVANWIMEARSTNFRRAMEEKELTQNDLDIMDENGDGKVSRAEYIEFMLVAMNKIDRSLLQELRHNFDKLDVDGTGELSRDDLVAAARRKCKSPQYKLGLSLYKKHLLEQGAQGNFGGLFGMNIGGNRRRHRMGLLFMAGKSFANALSMRK